MTPPLITNPPINTTIVYGQNATLHCKIMSDAQAHLQWVKHYKVNGTYFNENNDPYVVTIKVKVNIFTAYIHWYLNKTTNLPWTR